MRRRATGFAAACQLVPQESESTGALEKFSQDGFRDFCHHPALISRD
jgi:hypothetical protein